MNENWQIGLLSALIGAVFGAVFTWGTTAAWDSKKKKENRKALLALLTEELNAWEELFARMDAEGFNPDVPYSLSINPTLEMLLRSGLIDPLREKALLRSLLDLEAETSDYARSLTAFINTGHHNLKEESRKRSGFFFTARRLRERVKTTGDAVSSASIGTH